MPFSYAMDFNVSPISCAMSSSSRSLVLLCTLAAVFISGDIVFVFQIPMTVRWSQVLLLVVIILAVIRVVMTESCRWPLGYGWLLLWVGFIFVFIPNSDLPSFSMEYAAWLLFDAVLIFSVVQLPGGRDIEHLLSWYVLSFVPAALFGLFQFGAPFIGITPPLVRQWWIRGVVARINAFSYEPSYFAMYLSMGWIMSAYLLQHPVRWISKWLLRACFVIEGLALLLSGARTSWVLFVVWILQYPVKLLWHLAFGRLRMGVLRSTVMACVAVGLVVSSAIEIGGPNLSVIFRGMAVMGASSGSFDVRANTLVDTFRVFEDSPYLGRSLGGVNVAIAEQHGEMPGTFEEASKDFTGLSVFLEALAASGVVGFVPFMTYWAVLLWKPWRLTRSLPPDRRNTMIALIVSLMGSLLLLQINQNILRLYLWFHIAVLSALYHRESRDYVVRERWG